MSVGLVPIGARTWPERGVALAAWLDLGVDAYQQLAESHGFEPEPTSVVGVDRLTISSDAPRYASAGGWFALLTMTGAGEMVRGLAALYRSTQDRPLTRGHLPLVRSIQEHVGRVVWLCEPGAVVYGPGEDPTLLGEDAWRERRYRALLAHEEWMKDCASNLRLAGDSRLQEAEQALGEARSHVLAAQQGVQAPAAAMPGPTGFAELAQACAERLHGNHGIIAPKLGYKRASETTHGGLFGLHGDKTIDPAGRYVFEQSDGDLDASAGQVAAWWVTGVVVTSAAHAWDADTALQPFTDTWGSLFA